MRGKVNQETQEKIIDALVNERKRQELSHEKLGELSGLHRTAISHIENRKRNPTLISCLKISYALGISLGDIIKQAEQGKE